MEKKDWLNIKKNRQYTIEALYEFWKENRKPQYKDLTLEEFSELIMVYIHNNGSISDNKIMEFFDNKCSIMKIHDKNGKLIIEL